MTRLIRIGTRRSQLSQWQARHIASLIARHHPGARVELRHYATRGDRLATQPLPSVGGKGVFTQALEEALIDGEIDCAAHSLKDLPVAKTPGLALAAVPERGDHRDALVTRKGETLAGLPPGARIGTGSPRRCAQLLTVRADLRVLDIRGNVPTRLDKLLRDNSDFEGLVLAAAGLKRLNLDGHISEIFSDERMLCAPGQGALAVQCRVADRDFFGALNHAPSAAATAAERAFLRELQGGCSLPVGAYADIAAGGLRLRGRVMSPDGRARLDLRRELTLDSKEPQLSQARALGEALAQEALNQGADGLLGGAK